MAEDSDAFAKLSPRPFDRGKAERARLQFIETMAVIDAIDRAIGGEQAWPDPQRKAALHLPQTLKTAIDHALGVERQRLGIHHALEPRIGHHLGIDAVALRART